jgi:ubiquinol-cytochrome c reductase iron-sulfur subunit
MLGLAAPVEKGANLAQVLEMEDASNSETAPSTVGSTRRDFLDLAAVAFVGIGAAAALWPVIDQMNPDASTRTAGGPVDLDLSKLQPGQQVVVLWRAMPIFVINRPPDALERLQEPKLIDRLADAQSKVLQQPAYAENWHRSLRPEYAVLVGICTHLGCIPKFYPQPSANVPADDWVGGYFCACHGSKYDLAGRVFKRVPAPYNLPVPPYRFVDATTVRIGENPANVDFDFSSIRQI